MRNIIQNPLSLDELREVFAANPPRPLLPNRHDPIWREVAQKPLTQHLLAAILPRAIKEAGESLPHLTEELYSNFSRTGDRLTFEKVYFERRRRLARAVFCALFAPDYEKWVPRVLKLWDDIFGEESWALAPHVNTPSGRDPFTIDLFGAETANLMVEMLDLFADDAGQYRRAAIHSRLREQFFENFLKREDEDKPHWFWQSTTSNWNAVCHQGVLGAALAIEDDSYLLAQLFLEAQQYLKNFLSGFTPDGGCTEGAGYWNYGFGWFTVLNEQLEARTRGALSLIEGDSHVEEIARFGRRIMATPDYVVTYADGTKTSVARASVLSYLGNRLDDAGNQSAAASRYIVEATQPVDIDILRTDLFYLMRSVLFAPDTIPTLKETEFENVYLPDLGQWISHGVDSSGTRWAVAAKGGNNDEHHNHNDCGSFVLFVNGHCFIEEIGAPLYERDFFSSKRYQFLAARSLGHSLPIINGCEQQAGAEFAATITTAQFGKEFDEFAVDLTNCYPPEAKCARLQRTIRVYHQPFQLELTDEFETTEPVVIECALMTHCEVEEHGNVVVLRLGEQSLKVEFEESGARFQRVEELSYKRHNVGDEVIIQRLVFAPESDGLNARLTLRLGKSLS